MELTSAAAPCSWAKRKHRDVSRCRGVNAAHRAWERQRFAPATPSESAGAQRPGQNPKGATGVDAGRVRGVATRVGCHQVAAPCIFRPTWRSGLRTTRPDRCSFCFNDRGAAQQARRESATPGCKNLGTQPEDRKSTRLNSSHGYISYAVFCLKKKKPTEYIRQLNSTD